MRRAQHNDIDISQTTASSGKFLADGELIVSLDDYEYLKNYIKLDNLYAIIFDSYIVLLWNHFDLTIAQEVLRNRITKDEIWYFID